MAVTTYLSTDAGAPNSGGVFGYYAHQQHHFDALKAILKGCLVNGYTGKAAAGWVLVYEDARALVLRNGTASGYFCITNSENDDYRSACKISVAASFTSVANHLIVGDGAKTGVSANNVSGHYLNTHWFYAFAGFTTWKVLADDRTFNFSFTSGSNNTSEIVSDQIQACVVAGEDTAGNFLVVGGILGSVISLVNAFNYQAMTILRNPNTGALYGLNAVDLPRIPALHVQPLNTDQMPDVPVERLQLAPISWCVNGKMGGFLRGVGVDPNLLTRVTRNASHGVQPGKLYNCNAAVEHFTNLPGPYKVWQGQQRDAANTGAYYITDNPAFW